MAFLILIFGLFIFTANTGYAMLPDFEKVAEIALPSVVSVSVENFRNDNKSVGSGFIIDKDGYILTNNHILAHEENQAFVQLSTGETKEAELIARDEQTDIALLKILKSDDLKPVTFTSSKNIKVGTWVMAAGNPFGIGISASAGIVSALSRDMHAGPYDDFIQIDASLSLGSSGGPLFNLSGEVIGMNTALFSVSGETSRVGFAIPSDIVKSVAEDLKKYGKVRRSHLGIEFKDLTEEQKEMFNLKNGVLITSVEHNSPAYKVGLKPKDILLSFNHTPLKTGRDFSRLVAESPAQQNIPIEFLSDGEKISETVFLVNTDEKTSYPAFESPLVSKSVYLDSLETTVTTTTEELLSHFQLNPMTQGALITDISSSSSLAALGGRVGDVIIAIDEYEVKNMEDAVFLLTTNQSRKISLLLDGVGGLRYLTIERTHHEN